jgi:hypothetical protein
MIGVILLLTVLPVVVVVHALPVGFIDEGVGSGSEEATVGKFVPNPRKNGKPMLIVVAKDGPIYAFEDPDTSDTRILIGNLSNLLCIDGPRGILNMEPHPDFVSNRQIFLWYTRFAPGCPENAVTGPSNRLSRFTIDDKTLALNVNSEVVFLETSPSFYAIHDGGAMTIGRSDRMIYLAIGDGGSLKRGQEMDTLNGKMLRLTLNGTVPDNNPYTKASGGKGVNCRNNKGRPPKTAPAGSVCEEIYAIGFRNPYRIGYDMNTIDRVQFVVGDVGNAVWEDLSYGGTNHRGKNYGWPLKEGPCERNSNTVCPLPTINDTEPFYYYQHSNNGGAVTGAVFVPNNIWPVQYKFLFVEYVEGKIMNLIADNSVGCRSCTPPRPSYRNETFHEYERILDISFGPYNGTQQQAMYYISRRTQGQNIRRIRYVGGNNRSPQANIVVNPKPYLRNETITFVGSTSFDPEGDKLKYLWKFGDGRTSTLANKTISYSQLGTYQVELTVTDSVGLTSKAFTTIIVGTLPAVKIVTPSKQTQYQVGEVFRLVGNATSKGKPLNDQQLLWEVRLRHGGHYHPFLSPRTGNNFDLAPAPPPEDFMAATNSYLVVVLTATDSNGISRTIRRNIYPKKVLIDIDSTPSGMKVLIGDFNVVTPTTIVAWQNQNLKLEVEDQGSFVFKSWNIGGPRLRSYLVPPLNTTKPKIVAVFTKV